MHHLALPKVLPFHRRWNVSTKYRDSVAQAPSVLPKEGEGYLFDLGPNNASWEQMNYWQRDGSISSFNPPTDEFVRNCIHVGLHAHAPEFALLSNH